MKIYNAHMAETGEELGVVARTMNNAAEALVCFWVSRTGSPPGAFVIGSGPPPFLQSNPANSALLSVDIAGVIALTEDGSIIFEPAA